MHGALHTVGAVTILISQRLRLLMESSPAGFINRAIETSICGLMTKGLSSRQWFALQRDSLPHIRKRWRISAKVCARL